MAKLFEYWDVGEDETGRRWPNLGKASTACVMQALLKLDGRFTDSMIEGESTEADGRRLVSYRIVLPVGSQEAFEELTGYRLSRPPNVGGI